MGCFMTQKNKKKQTEQAPAKTVNPSDNKPALLPEPVGCSALDSQESQNQTKLLRSGPPSFRSKVRTIQHVNWLINNKPRALSAPSSFSRTEQDNQKDLTAKCDQDEEKQHKISPSPSVRKRPSLASDSVQSLKNNSASGPISPLSGALCSDKKAFSGQPVPLPSPRRPPLLSDCTSSLRCPPRESVSCTSLSPTPHSGAMKKHGSFKGSGAFKVSGISGSEPLPLPLPKECSNLHLFTYEELSTACNGFSFDFCIFDGNTSSMYKGFIRDEATGQKTEVAVSRFFATSQSHKEFVNDIKKISLLQHPNLSKLVGFHARENACERMLVFEKLPNGSLDHLLYGRVDGPPIDWSTRMKIALGAAQGLTYLHEEGPCQAMYCEFKPPNIHVDKDFSAKLIDYGLSTYSQEMDPSSNSFTEMVYAAPETLTRGLLTPKSNVWSFGIVLLELLTGRQNMDSSSPKDERNLVKWTRSFLTDEFRLSLIMDPRLKGRFSIKAAKIVADLALKCLHKDPSERPTMRKTVEILKSVQDIKYSSKFPLKEPNSPKNEIIPQHFSKPTALPLPRRPALMPVQFFNSQPLLGTKDASLALTKNKEMCRSPSLNGLRTSGTQTTSNMAVSPLKPLKPLIIPSRSCASTIKQCEEAPSPRQTPARVEGF
eukprot:TRINITY_DN4101_c0_g3_i1.p1 TRINITY_DN4101_c0_g3~~TRINITY_DN4101_c0_g3_i1.p1  ORF type:complete len:656 (+),score=107.45 TRINITY_DN4101_c0_g3_i1:530-2497(+)